MAEPQGDLKPREDSELLKPAVLETFVPEAGPVQLLTLGPALSTSADTQSHLGVAADVEVDVAVDVPEDVAVDVPEDVPADVATDVPAGGPADVPPARHLFLSAVVQLGAPECVSPLPEVDI